MLQNHSRRPGRRRAGAEEGEGDLIRMRQVEDGVFAVHVIPHASSINPIHPPPSTSTSTTPATKPKFNEDYTSLFSLALSDYALWADSDLCRALDFSREPDEKGDGGFFPLAQLLKRSKVLAPLALENVQVQIVKALRAEDKMDHPTSPNACIQALTFPPHHQEKPNALPTCKGFALVRTQWSPQCPCLYPHPPPYPRLIPSSQNLNPNRSQKQTHPRSLQTPPTPSAPRIRTQPPPETNKTTLHLFFARAVPDSPLDCVDFTEGIDFCHLRLAAPAHAQALMTHFTDRPMAQLGKLDDTGGDGGPVRVELVEGTQERVYWEWVPEKIRREAVRKALGDGAGAGGEKGGGAEPRAEHHLTRLAHVPLHDGWVVPPLLRPFIPPPQRWERSIRAAANPVPSSTSASSSEIPHVPANPTPSNPRNPFFKPFSMVPRAFAPRPPPTPEQLQRDHEIRRNLASVFRIGFEEDEAHEAQGETATERARRLRERGKEPQTEAEREEERLAQALRESGFI
ncbi:hypothetical protein DXG01_014241 [Tephrocybe rancida]|nr:hypothetical protein DXG01_014241 [Tephrocybe rancida]